MTLAPLAGQQIHERDQDRGRHEIPSSNFLTVFLAFPRVPH
jgi:hypothetical protein